MEKKKKSFPPTTTTTTKSAPHLQALFFVPFSNRSLSSLDRFTRSIRIRDDRRESFEAAPKERKDADFGACAFRLLRLLFSVSLFLSTSTSDDEEDKGRERRKRRRRKKTAALFLSSGASFARSLHRRRYLLYFSARANANREQCAGSERELEPRRDGEIARKRSKSRRPPLERRAAGKTRTSPHLFLFFLTFLSQLSQLSQIKQQLRDDDRAATGHDRGGAVREQQFLVS